MTKTVFFKRGQRVGFEIDSDFLGFGVVVEPTSICTEIDGYVCKIKMDNPEYQEHAYDICYMGMADECFSVIPAEIDTDIGWKWFKFVEAKHDQP